LTNTSVIHLHFDDFVLSVDEAVGVVVQVVFVVIVVSDLVLEAPFTAGVDLGSDHNVAPIVGVVGVVGDVGDNGTS